MNRLTGADLFCGAGGTSTGILEAAAHELAAAMSFPKDYKFSGNRGDQVKQIGNAVPVQLARACAVSLLTQND